MAAIVPAIGAGGDITIHASLHAEGTPESTANAFDTLAPERATILRVLVASAGGRQALESRCPEGTFHTTRDAETFISTILREVREILGRTHTPMSITLDVVNAVLPSDYCDCGSPLFIDPGWSEAHSEQDHGTTPTGERLH